MRSSDFTDRSPGELITIGNNVVAFLPNLLPPIIDYDEDLASGLADAAHAVGRLDSTILQGANPLLLIRPFQLREAIASSQIEGTQTELRQLLLFQAAEQAADAPADVREVINYIRALTYGFTQPQERDFSVSLIKEMHRLLLEGARGQEQRPGELRTDQVWIAGEGLRIEQARFIPPPALSVPGLLDDLAKFINEENRVPPLIRVALVHYQFEAIHPFADGNGRIGRLMIPLLLVRWGLMTRPALYMSDYFNVNRDLYVNALLRVSQGGDWRHWIDLFILAVRAQALDASIRSKKLHDLRNAYRRRYETGRTSANLLRVVDILFQSPAITVPSIEKRLGISYPTASKWVEMLVNDGVLIEVTQRTRNRVFMAREIYDIVDAAPWFATDQPEPTMGEVAAGPSSEVA